MWGYSEEVPDDLMRFHLGLSDRLASLSWSRIQVWNASVSVHEWVIDSKSYSFDAKFNGTQFELLLVSRDVARLPRVENGLKLEGINFSSISGRNDRVLLARFSEYSISSLIDEVSDLVINVRNSIALNVHENFTYKDDSTGLDINFSVKKERKSNKQLIFIFSSIRSKAHWTDFNGPLGESLQTLRARVVFIADDAGSEFVYNFSHRGNLDVMKSNINFIENYVLSNGYSWSNVTIAGLSKGGTSALVIGSQLPSCSIVSLAPQLRLGNYLLRSNRHQIIEEMSGRVGRDGAALLDEFMWKVLESSSVFDGIKNCYILTSLGDPDCYDGLDRIRLLSDRMSNFRLESYVDNSPFTETHLKTVHYLTPTFINLLGILASGIRPTSMDRVDE